MTTINGRPERVEDIASLYGHDVIMAITLATGISFPGPSNAPPGLRHEARLLDEQRCLRQTGITIGDMARFYLRKKLAEAEARAAEGTY